MHFLPHVISAFRELRRVSALAMMAGIVLLAFPVLPRAQTPSAKAQSAASARNTPKKPLLVPRGEYVGDEACARCHEDKAESYDKTAHHWTSQLANKNTILGTFASGENIMRTSNANLHFRLEAKDAQFFEAAVWGTPPNEKTRTHSLDLVIGSGQQGQSFLHWDDDQLFGLPVGYSTIMHRWINGPGYVDGTAKFDRGIIPRCLECHAAYFESKFPSADSNVYNTANFVLGISCERCHGAGRGNVQAQERQRRTEICGQCHGGHGAPEALPAFSYVPGQPLGITSIWPIRAKTWTCTGIRATSWRGANAFRRLRT
jgi:predicted CXXCH cytochrome family protein